jgi:hydroxymethylpyrimidine pyrophosphatase-like HAD family hydrolase
MDARIIISDLDGTLSDPAHRIKLYRDRKYEEFNKAGKDDKPLQDICNILRSVSDSETHIVICTARSESCRKDTLQWLELNEVPCGQLIMRRNGDNRSDAVVKKEMLDQLLETYKFSQFWFVLEDRNQCVDMWRGEGLVCLQVAPGDF